MTTTGQSINRGSYGINILLSYSFLKAMTNITTNLTGMVLYIITTARHRETQDTRLLHTEWITRWVMGPQVDLLLKIHWIRGPCLPSRVFMSEGLLSQLSNFAAISGEQITSQRMITMSTLYQTSSLSSLKQQSADRQITLTWECYLDSEPTSCCS